jgi:hypothetical protein
MPHSLLRSRRAWTVAIAVGLALLALGGLCWWLDKDRLTSARLDAMIRESLPPGSTRAEVESWLGTLPYDTSSYSPRRTQLVVTIHGVNGRLSLWPGQQHVTFEFEFVSLKLRGHTVEPHFAD